MIVVLNKLGPSLNLGGPACCILLLIINYLFMGCGDRDAVVVDPLESALVKIEDNSDAVRLEGINELSSLGDKAKPHAAKIALLLKDSSAEIRNIAVSLIGVWQYQDSGVLVDLKTLAVDDDDMDVRGNALRTLLMIGASDSFTSVVKAVLAGEDTEFKEEVLVILVESSKEAVLLVKAELEAIAKGSNKEMAEDAKLALKLLGE